MGTARRLAEKIDGIVWNGIHECRGRRGTGILAFVGRIRRALARLTNTKSMRPTSPSIDVYHNILWSRYKGLIFSSLHSQFQSEDVSINFFQIAETEASRAALGQVDLASHRYPYELVFKGSYDLIPKWRLVAKLFMKIVRSNAKVIVLPGYSNLEHWAMWAAALVRGKRRTFFCDSTIMDRPQGFIKGLLKKLFFTTCHGAFAYGFRSREYLVSYGMKSDRIFSPCQAAALPEPIGVHIETLRGTAPRFLYVGRLAPEKGLDTLLRAFAQFYSDHPEASLVIVGAGDQKNELSELSARLGLGAALEFKGTLLADKLAAEYLRATCLVLPSTSEPWGLVVNEAMSYGCPAIVSSICGCVPELIFSEKTGFVFEVGDVKGLSAAMEMALSTFRDSKLTADLCMATVSAYTPSAAAQKIHDGLLVVMSEENQPINIDNGRN